MKTFEKILDAYIGDKLFLANMSKAQHAYTETASLTLALNVEGALIAQHKLLRLGQTETPEGKLPPRVSCS